MVVRWTAPASLDLERIARRISKDNRAAARRVVSTIFNAGNELNTFPERGRGGRILGTRELVFPGWPYILIYQIIGDVVEVLRIYHSAQNWP